MNDQNRIISKNLKYLLSKKGVSQKEVADALGITPQSFNAWVNGIAAPRMGKIQLLADYFGVNKTDIIEDKEINEAFEALTAVDILKSAFKKTGYYSGEFTDDEIIDIMKYAEFVQNKRG